MSIILTNKLVIFHEQSVKNSSIVFNDIVKKIQNCCMSKSCRITVNWNNDSFDILKEG